MTSIQNNLSLLWYHNNILLCLPFLTKPAGSLKINAITFASRLGETHVIESRCNPSEIIFGFHFFPPHEHMVTPVKTWIVKALRIETRVLEKTVKFPPMLFIGFRIRIPFPSQKRMLLADYFSFEVSDFQSLFEPFHRKITVDAITLLVDMLFYKRKHINQFTLTITKWQPCQHLMMNGVRLR